MPVVSPDLVKKFVEEDELLAKAYNLLEKDEEVQDLLKMANIMAVTRLGYNDHGVVHARIVSGAALQLLDILLKNGVEPTTLKNKVTANLSEAKLVILMGAYLHDIGNSIHRKEHHIHGYVLAIPILNRLLKQLISPKRLNEIRQEILHIIYSHDENVKCLTVEAGVVKVADGLDMAEGRARVPYKLGKVDIHSLSALAIEKVEILEGDTRPVKVVVHMTSTAGVFQIEEVLMRKIMTSGLDDYIEIEALIDGKVLKGIKP